jgi:hypothetical protein
VWLVQRISVGGGDLSLSDFVMLASGALAIPTLGLQPLPPAARRIAWGFAGYTGALLATVAFHPDGTSIIELFHRGILVIGALLAGLVVYRAGRSALALRLLIVASCFYAVVSMELAVRSGFDPAFPFGIHKNYAGSLFSSVALLCIAAYPVTGLPGRLKYPILALLGGGLLASQSRGAALGLIAGLLALVVCSGRARSLASKIGSVVVVMLLLVFVVTTVQDQQEERSSGRNTQNSLAEREDVETATHQVFKEHPVTGVGLKFFEGGGIGDANQAPNNVLNEASAEAGVIGLLAFLLFHGFVLVALFRLRSALGLMALAVLMGQLVHGQVDIFWTSGTAALPWVFVGIACAATDKVCIPGPAARGSALLGRS